MANLIFPKRWTSKPPLNARINWGHPLAKDLSILMLFNEGAGEARNLWNNGTSINATGGENNVAMSWLASQQGGLAKKTTSTNDAWRFTDSTRWVATDRATILVGRKFSDTTLRGGGTFGVEDPVNTFNFRCGAHAPFSDGVIYWDFGGVGGANRLTYSGYTKATNNELWAFRAGQGGSSIWKDRQKVASQSTAITRVASTNDFVVNGGNQSVQLGDLQEWFFFALYKAELTDSQIQWWMNEPFGMLIPQRQRQRSILVPVGSAPPPPVTSAQPVVLVIS